MRRGCDRVVVASIESLESRQLLSAFVVTNANDSGAGSLRQAIADANSAAGADVIEFDPGLSGASIGLTSGDISISDDLTINGLGEDALDVSGQRISRVFTIESSASVVVRDLTLKWGQVDGGVGGLIYVSPGTSLSMYDATLTDTQALAGGAIANGGSLSLTRCTIDDAGAFNQGGAIVNYNGSVHILHSTLRNNFTGSGGDGGAIWSDGYDATVEIKHSTLAGNTADDDGGAIHNTGSTTVICSTISGNTAGGQGGGIYDWGLSLKVYNSTIVENTASSGGGVFMQGSAATVISSIIALNSEDISGGYLSTNNLIGGDPRIGALEYNGGPTQTRALLDGSPALGAGSNPLNLQTDQRGGAFSRNYGGSIDIGAYQRQPITQIVDTVSDVDNGDYSPGDLSLREAISRSNADPELYPIITFDPSLNDVTITLTGGELMISSSVDIQGPGRNLLRVFADYGSRILNISGDDVSLSGMAFDAGSGDQGGAVLSSASQLRLTDVGVLNSQASSHGGGLYIASGEVTISDSVFNSNASNAGGGGIYAQSGTLTIGNSQITSNTASFAGGIGSEGVLTIDGCTVEGNSAEGNSGGIENWNSAQGVATLTITNSSITANSAGDNGGGVRAYNGQLSITGSDIYANTAGGSGGGVNVEGGGASAAIGTSTIRFNTADGGGGGVFVTGGTLLLNQSLVWGNRSHEDGGGVRLRLASDSTIQNCTIVGNGADGWGGGIATYTLSSPTYTILNSTITANTSDSDQNRTDGYEVGGGLQADGGIVLLQSTIVDENLTGTTPNDISGTLADASSHNLVGDAASTANLSEANSNLLGVSAQLAGGLTNNGGLTLSLALTRGSPAVDAGSNPASLAYDQRGEPRTRGNGTDIGAIESTYGVSVRIIDGGSARSTSLADNTVLTAARNSDGELIVFTGSGSGWTVLRLADGTKAPPATDDPIIWTDPNDALAYLAAPSGNGFLLFRRGANGSWSYVDLAAQTGSVADAPSGTLGYFVTRPKSGAALVVIAGVNDAGEIVSYSQTGASDTSNPASWSFYNISDDLASQGMSTPRFTKLSTYVTSWNQWTIAGLDAAGNVQGVWVNVASFTTWRVDNLSAITGADPLAGELDVTLTPWGGIRFAGSNSSGHLVGTWWNPGRGPGNWTQTDMTEQVAANAPTLNPGRLTAWFIGVNNMISYAGYNASGDIVSLFWQPGDGGVWSADNLTDALENRGARPVGALSTHVGSDGETSITGASSDGSIVRLWASAENRAFNLDNLSELAVRV